MRPLRQSILATVIVLAPAMRAQAPGAATLTAATELKTAPDGGVIAALRPGAGIQVRASKSGWSQVVVDGWLHVSVLGPKRDSFALSVKSPNGALMRSAADRTAPVVAQFDDGTGLLLVSRSAQWSQVRRIGWVPAKLVKAGAPPPFVATKPAPPSAAPAGPAATPSAAPAEPDVPPESLPGDVAVVRRTGILTAPSGRALGNLDSATRLVTGPSERGWVRVTLEGWVRQADLIPLDSSATSTISAADLRSDPDRYQGRVVRWVVQIIAFQTADPLRKGLGPDEPYLLARGPGNESSLLYLAIPPSMLDAAKALDPLSTAVVLARVRQGRSEPSGVPILDLQRVIER
jgi:SH3-like domain-containing protein